MRITNMNMLKMALVSTGLLALAGCIAPEPGYYGGGPAYYGGGPRYYGAPAYGGGVYIGGFDERRDRDHRGGDRDRREGRDR
jgi:hypothetical protein